MHHPESITVPSPFVPLHEPQTARELAQLLELAGKTRRATFDRKPFTCAILNAKSGLCAEDCSFCAQSSHHRTGITGHDLMDEKRILEAARGMAGAGIDRFSLVTSGTAVSNRELDRICRVAEKIIRTTNLKLCASLGMLTPETALSLRHAGISRYHHNLETARTHFPAICTTHTYDDSLSTLNAARSGGLQICCGGIFGLGESWMQRIEFGRTLNSLGPDCIPMNFLQPVPGTPLESAPRLTPRQALAGIALIRLLNPKTSITIAGGRRETLGDFQSWIFQAGADGMMIGDYLTTTGRDMTTDLNMLREIF
jgi:biotin synthase